MIFKRFLNQLLAILFQILVWLLFCPVLVVSFVFFLIRIFTHLTARVLRPDLIPIYNAMDHILALEPSSSAQSMSIGASLILDNKIDVDLFRSHFYQTFLSQKDSKERYTNLYCYFVKWGLFVFKKSTQNLNLNDKIKETSLTCSSFEEIEEFLRHYSSVQNYAESPHWEILLINVKSKMRFDSNTSASSTQLSSETIPKAVIVLKFHHGLCDGYSLIHIIDKLCGTKSPYRVRSTKLTFWNKVSTFFSLHKNLLLLSVRLARSGLLPWSEICVPHDEPMYLSFTKLDLHKLQHIKQNLNCHFNALLSVIAIESLRRFFESKGKTKEIPDTAVVCFPVGRPNHPVVVFGGPLQNHLSVMALPISLKTKDLLLMLKKAEEDYIMIENELKVPYLVQSFLLPLAWTFPQSIFQLYPMAMKKLRLFSKLETTISPNILSPDGYTLLGKPVRSIYPHVRIRSLSLVQAAKLQIITFSIGNDICMEVAGRTDSFKSKKEVSYIANKVFKEVVDELLEVAKTNSDKHF